MGKTLITDFLIYRWRYAIGYTAITIAFIALVLFAGLYVPGGLNDREIQNLPQTAAMSLKDPSSLAIINMPYYALQHLSLSTLGVSNFSIKLVSLLCAFATGVGAVLLLRRWYRPNIAVLSAIIMITTGQFLFVAQSGVGSILYILWSVWLLLAATMITSSKRFRAFWKIIFFILLPLSLYTPLSLYLVLAIVSAAILHPHVRQIIKRMHALPLIGLLLMSSLIMAPLGYLIYLKPQLGLQLLGIPTNWPPDFLANAQTLVQQYLNFITPQSGSLMAPVLGLGSIMLIVLGIWQLYKTRYMARSYTMTAWCILLIPVLLINPMYTTVTFVPFLLLLASGLNYLLRAWYKMFPRNPYARIAGLVPLIILVSGLVVSGVGRYVYGYHYDPDTAKSFSRDLTLYNYQIKDSAGTTLLVSKSEKPFYDVVSKYNKNAPLTVVTSQPDKQDFTATKAGRIVVTDRQVSRITTTGYSSDSDRFYTYKK